MGRPLRTLHQTHILHLRSVPDICNIRTTPLFCARPCPQAHGATGLCVKKPLEKADRRTNHQRRDSRYWNTVDRRLRQIKPPKPHLFVTLPPPIPAISASRRASVLSVAVPRPRDPKAELSKNNIRSDRGTPVESGRFRPCRQH